LMTADVKKRFLEYSTVVGKGKANNQKEETTEKNGHGKKE